MTYKFNELWDFAQANCKVLAQEKIELATVFSMMLGCDSYLEIGSSEGNSLYILGHALNTGGNITYVDRNENHTRPWREPKEKLLAEHGYNITPIHGNTHDPDSIRLAGLKRYDCILIDAGHTYDDVIQDARNYAPLADKYIFFHDIRIPETMRAFLDWLEETKATAHLIVNSKKYGFGVVKK